MLTETRSRSPRSRTEGALVHGVVTNLLERLNWEVKRRIDVVGIFPNPAAPLRLATCVLIETHEEWKIGDRRYPSEESMTQLRAQGVGTACRPPRRPREQGELHRPYGMITAITALRAQRFTPLHGALSILMPNA
ncbi:transposase (plasmid) [Rhodococcus opacus]